MSTVVFKKIIETVMNKNINKMIVLVGLMGVGKTSIGKRLAERMGLDFIDLDNEIERQTGCSVAEIFERFGEPEFRRMEISSFKRLVEDNQTRILALGGGAFVNPEIRELVKEKAISVWLKAKIEVLVERVSRRNTRPLLEKGDKHEIMRKLMDERYPIYAEADIMVESDEGPHQKVVDKIIEKIREHGKQ